MKIKIDYNFCMEDIIGKDGISQKEISKLSQSTEEVHKKIIKERDNDIIGFYKLPFLDCKDIKNKAKIFRENYKTCVLIGIGGSALGANAIFTSLSKFFDNRLFIIDNVDPDIFYELIDKINIKETFFVVVSKSGGTAETISNFLVFRKYLIDNLGFEEYKKRVVIITDSKKGPLRELVLSENLESFSIPENVGGRFSVLSAAGLFPLSFVGIDIELILEGAIYMSNILQNDNIFENPSYLLGSIHYLAYHKGKSINVFMPYSSKLHKIADWFIQLWAESLGKELIGITPLKAIGATDQHSQLQLFMEGSKDKLVTFIQIEKFKNDILIPEQDISSKYKYLFNHSMGELLNNECNATKAALAINGIMNYTILLEDLNPFILGELLFMFQVMTHYTGYLFEINPFNQPGVELGKEFTYSIMGRDNYAERHHEYLNLISRSKKEYIL